MDAFDEIFTRPAQKQGGLAHLTDRRRDTRAPVLRSSHSGLASNLWELELLPATALDRLAKDIDALALRTVDENLFFESTVLRAAWPRLTTLLAPKGVWMMCLWETIGESRHLRFFAPVRLNTVGLPPRKVLQVLSHEFLPAGTPLIDAECAGEAAETLLRLLSDPQLSVPSVLDFTDLMEESATYRTLEEAGKNLGLKQMKSNRHFRAALFAKEDPKTFIKTHKSKKHKREMARQFRLLAKDAELFFEHANETDQVLDAFENFMALEVRGWKGRGGTALYNHKKIASFSRQIVAELTACQSCEIFALVRRANGKDKTVASVIFLGNGGKLAPWKMTYDEDYSACSPGMQIMVHATEQLIMRPSFVVADSLAPQDHWMMNNVWPDRIAITDLTFAVTDGANHALTKTVEAKRRYTRLKNNAKAVLKKLKTLSRKIF